VVGKPIQEATDSLARTRLTILTLSVTTDRVRPGTVLAQRPAGGTPVTRAKVESLWVANGPRTAGPIGQRPATVAATAVAPPPARAPDDVARPPKDVVVPKDPGLTTMVPGVVVQARTKVPDLFRLTPQEVPAALERYQLRQGETTRDYSDDVPSGRVFRQHPQAGAEAITWSTVDIWYSTGSHPPATEVTVPSVVGLSLREAVDSLRRVGLRPGHIDRFVAMGARGSVVDQTPDAGKSVHRDESVDLTVAVAPSRVRVPSVVGLPRSAAEDSLKAAGLGVGAVTLISVRDQNEVIVRQLPVARTPADSGSLVDLVENRRPETRMVRVPDVTGLTIADAANTLRSDSLFLGAVLRPGVDPVDRIASQNPAAESDAYMHTAVDVTLGSADSAGSTVDLLEVPDVLNLPSDSARRVLVERGFTRLSFRSEGGALISGSVVVAQDPSGGDFASPGLLVSLVTGPPARPPVLVPGLITLNPDMARDVAAVRGLQMVVGDEIRRLRLTAVVLTQEPEQGSPLPPGNAVTVTVAIPVVPPVAVAIAGAAVVFAGVGQTIRGKVREKPEQKKQDKPDQGGIELDPEPGIPTITLDDPSSGRLIQKWLTFRIEVSEGLVGPDALEVSLIKSWKPRDA
jgi:beta-lactam-binding protein with PASTA domain